MKSLENITEFLNTHDELSQDKLDTLFEVLYPEVKKIANAQLHKMSSHHVMSATVLVNECYLKLKKSKFIHVKSEKHFYTLTSRCMRFYLVDIFRNSCTDKNKRIETEFHMEKIEGEGSVQIDLLELEHALKQLEQINKNLLNIVELRFFGGFSLEEIADLYSTNISSIYQKWLLAKSLILNFIKSDE